MNTANRMYLFVSFSILAILSAPIHGNRSAANDRYTYTHYPPSHYQQQPQANYNGNSNNNQQRHVRTYTNNSQAVSVHHNSPPYNPHQQCNVPSDFWCDSHEMAQKCGVVSQCDVSAFKSPAVWWVFWVEFQNLRRDRQPLKVSIMYEALCPFCQRFIANNLGSLHSQFRNQVSIEMVPWGNAILLRVCLSLILSFL